MAMELVWTPDSQSGLLACDEMVRDYPNLTPLQ